MPAVEPTGLNGVLLIKPDVFGDDRGYFKDLYHLTDWRGAGLPSSFATVQTSVSKSARGVLRGLHYQNPAQAKLITVVAGEIFDVAVDIRKGSPTFGKWFGSNLSDANHYQLFIPRGFAHGFCVLSETATVHYQFDVPYASSTQRSVRWDDPAIGIKWPIQNLRPDLSAKDASGKPLKDIASEDLPVYERS